MTKNRHDTLDADALVRQYDGLARKMASRYAGLVDFADLYQVARMAIWAAKATFDPKRGSLVTHLYKSALYAVLEEVKNERGGVLRLPADTGSHRENPPGPRPRCVLGEIPAGMEPQALESGMGMIENKSALSAIYAAAALTPKQSEVIRLLFEEGLSFGEVVVRLECTEQNVHYLRKIALEKMRLAASDQGIDFADLIG